VIRYAAGDEPMQPAKPKLTLLYDRYLLAQVILSAVMASASFLPMSFDESLEAIRPGAGTRYLYPGLDPRIVFSLFAPFVLASASYLLTKSPVLRTLAALATLPLAFDVIYTMEWVGLGRTKLLLGRGLCENSAVALLLICIGHLLFCLKFWRGKAAA
jgi:hypothetical protein